MQIEKPEVEKILVSSMFNGTTSIKPGMGQIVVQESEPGLEGSSNVNFEVQLPDIEEVMGLLITLCVTIEIGQSSISLYYTKTVVSTETEPIIFKTGLPNNALI
ncbi:MAG: hypothetical protein ACRDA5_09435, partial [Clostridium sp.]